MESIEEESHYFLKYPPQTREDVEMLEIGIPMLIVEHGASHLEDIQFP
jgi:hypothetical protein